MTFEIIEDFLEKEDFDHIITTLFPNNDDLTRQKDPLVWNYNKGIVRDPDNGPTGYEENDWMYSKVLFTSHHSLLRYDKHYPLDKPIVDKLDIKKLLDVRCNLLVPTKEHIYHEFHTDRTYPHKVALFYVTNNNGWTVLKDTAKVECVENRMLLFDGMIEHHSVSSTDKLRCAINVNYI